MNGKLNLSIDENLKEKIKEYAAVRNLSLSILVENYFKNLLYSSGTGELNTPITDSLVGILESLNDIEYKTARLEHLEGKYLSD
ncbi:MAG TPA: hypothetical protein DCO79_07325 [Spirochaeta sp.]|nr:hypothetical protein [Spirochaeta sp.]